MPSSRVEDAEELRILDYEGLLAATPNESPENYTAETFEGLADWIESNITDWVRMAIEQASDEAEAEEAYRAQVEQRDADPNETSLRLEALRTIIAKL